jgi:hypothetical protein
MNPAPSPPVLSSFNGRASDDPPLPSVQGAAVGLDATKGSTGVCVGATSRAVSVDHLPSSSSATGAGGAALGSGLGAAVGLDATKGSAGVCVGATSRAVSVDHLPSSSSATGAGGAALGSGLGATLGAAVMKGRVGLRRGGDVAGVGPGTSVAVLR